MCPTGGGKGPAGDVVAEQVGGQSRGVNPGFRALSYSVLEHSEPGAPPNGAPL